MSEPIEDARLREMLLEAERDRRQLAEFELRELRRVVESRDREIGWLRAQVIARTRDCDDALERAKRAETEMARMQQDLSVVAAGGAPQPRSRP